MIKRYNTVPRLLALLAVLVAGHQAAFAQSASQIVKRVQDRYRSVQTLQADFTQTVSGYGNGSQTVSGKVYLQGDKYRVEAPRQTLVTDGRVTWIYNRDENQVLVNDATRDETTFSLNEFLFDFDRHYTPASARAVTLNGRKHFLLQLKPKHRSEFFRDVTLWVRDRDYTITRIDVVDLNDTKMSFALNNIQLNPKLAASVFTFRAPRGAEVVDLRS